MAIRNYVGARYVPKFANPVEWQENTSYEAMVIVTYNNSSYTSKVPVPPTVGNPAENSTYWALTGNYNAQVEQYRQEAEQYRQEAEQYRQEVEQYGQETENVKINYSKCFNTAANMIADTSLTEGMIVKTLGYNKIDDNGGAFYKIYNTKEHNSEHYENLSNGKYALLIHNGYITPEMFGAKGDGVTDDATAIQSAIYYAIDNHTHFIMCPKMYAVGAPINVLTTEEAQKDEFFDFGGGTLIPLVSMEEVVRVATSESGFGQDIAKNTRVIKNLIVNCNELADYGIYHKMGRNLWYVDCTIQNAKVCAFYADGQAQIDRMLIDRRMYNYQCTGIQLNMTDNKINNVRMRDCKTGMVINGASSFITNVHCWLINSTTVTGSKCFVINHGNIHMTNCYADTYEMSWVINVASPIFLSNCKMYINTSFYNNNININIPSIFSSDVSPTILQSSLNSNLKMFGFEPDTQAYANMTGNKVILAKGLTSKDLYSYTWNIFAALNKGVTDAELDGLPTVVTNGALALRNIYTVSKALNTLRDPTVPTITIEGNNEITIVSNEIINNGFSASGFLRIEISSQTQEILLSGLPAPLKTVHILGYSTANTQNAPNKITHFIINKSGILSVFGYSSNYPLTGEWIIPIEYSVLSK